MLIVFFCYILSGFTSLSCEICWIRKSSLVFGATSHALSTVVAIFFGGLALGSVLFGRIAMNVSKPIRLYAFLEIGVGSFVLLTPLLFAAQHSLYSLIYPFISQNIVHLTFTRLVFVAALLLPPTLLMGGTYPVLIKRFVKNNSHISKQAGFLYGANTLGAAAGAVLTGTILIPVIGARSTLFMCAAMNILCGLILILCNVDLVFTSKNELYHQPEPMVDSPRNVKGGKWFRRIVMALFFITGFVALANEILWTRFLSLIIHNTVYTYTISLTVTLFGIVCGSLLISLVSDKMRQQTFVFSITQFLTGLSIVFVLFLPPECWRLLSNARGLERLVILSFCLFFIPAVLSGVAFPLGIKMVTDSFSKASFQIGELAAFNTLGGILGSLTAGFFLIPLLGLENSVKLITFMSLGCGLGALFLLNHSIRSGHRIAITVIAFSLWFLIPFVSGTRLPLSYITSDKKTVVALSEGVNSNICVSQVGSTKVLEIDRMWQGTNQKNHQIMAAHVPMALHPYPRDILVVGVGVGQTASRFLYYNIDSLDCVDIEPDLFSIIKTHFDAAWLNSPSVRVIVEDGRNFIEHTAKKYDVISIEIGQVFRPHLSSFYTMEFYQALKKKLKPNGLVCQFLPIAIMNEQILDSALKSFQIVFPRCQLWYNTNEFLLVGSNGPLHTLSSERFESLVKDKRIRNDLDFSYWGGDKNSLNQLPQFASGFLLGPDSVSKLTENADVFHDDPPSLEYLSAAANIGHADSMMKYLREVTKLLSPIPTVLPKCSPDLSDIINEKRSFNLRDIQARKLFQKYLDSSDAESLLESYKANPRNPRITFEMGVRKSKENEHADAAKYFQETIRLTPKEKLAHYNLAMTRLQMGDFSKAAAGFIKVIELDPDHAESHNNLGVVLARMGQTRKAIASFKKAIEIQPDYQNARKNLELLSNKQLNNSKSLKTP